MSTKVIRSDDGIEIQCNRTWPLHLSKVPPGDILPNGGIRIRSGSGWDDLIFLRWEEVPALISALQELATNGVIK